MKLRNIRLSTFPPAQPAYLVPNTTMHRTDESGPALRMWLVSAAVEDQCAGVSAEGHLCVGGFLGSDSGGGDDLGVARGLVHAIRRPRRSERVRPLRWRRR